jgi:ubiquinone/menaquinone biosynthesis C-methylase UbiE
MDLFMSTTQTPAPSTFDDGEWYDIMCQGLDYGMDFYAGLAREAKGPVLEIACGTGRILIPCAQAGIDIEGLDLYEGMLATLRRKATALGLSPTLYRADMGDFQLPRNYAFIMITFNAFGHNMTQEAQIRCLERCRQHLLPGGILALDGAFPGVEWVGAPQGMRVLEGETIHPQTGLPIRCYDTRRFDRVKQIQYSTNEVEMLDGKGNVTEVYRSQIEIRWIYKEEMALLLRVAGFPRWEICGGFDRRLLLNETDQMVVLAYNDSAAGPA